MNGRVQFVIFPGFGTHFLEAAAIKLHRIRQHGQDDVLFPELKIPGKRNGPDQVRDP